MVSVIFGSNSYGRKHALDLAVSDFLKKAPDTEVRHIQATDVDSAELRQALQSTGLFSQSVCIVLHDASKNKQLTEAFESVLDAVDKDSLLVVVEQNLDKRTSFSKLLTKQGDVTECSEQDEHSLRNWVLAEVKRRGGSISSADAGLLLSKLGTNQWSLSTEIDKLLIHSSSITKESIELLVEPSAQEKIFALTDAVSYGNTQRASAILDNLFQQQLEARYVMSMLGWQIHNMVIMAGASGDSAYLKEMKINPFVARKTSDVVRRISRRTLADLVGIVIEGDRLSKSSAADNNEIVSHTVYKLCQAVKRST